MKHNTETHAEGKTIYSVEHLEMKANIAEIDIPQTELEM